MTLLPNLIFAILFFTGIAVFAKNVKKIIRNIRLGISENRSDQSPLRWKQMLRVALGQSKMVSRPIAGALHIVVYIGFIIINIELLEIIVDGFLGTHRVFAPYLGTFYLFLIASFEILALLVIVAVFFFWTRRNIIKIKRFFNFCVFPY